MLVKRIQLHVPLNQRNVKYTAVNPPPPVSQSAAGRLQGDAEIFRPAPSRRNRLIGTWSRRTSCYIRNRSWPWAIRRGLRAGSSCPPHVIPLLFRVSDDDCEATACKMPVLRRAWDDWTRRYLKRAWVTSLANLRRIASSGATSMEYRGASPYPSLR
ncbi:hypothetical protein EJ06DRAFT_140607 [Trichodelitschia bisporula]|uniref:Uncharacterized protein n=1 Tax=Trichodelitschia bisporula TaxID=703511 RepID=A0A6G1HPJ8_9PEZI|nr:hypothetical protein EJ06DRAFT_140607 [Trichodelitschia bisporula]